MNIEHIALNVADPVALAEWYTCHLGMRVVRSIAESPHTRFLADESGRVVVEVYRQKAPVPDYASFDPMTLHLAFTTADLGATRDRLLAAGATTAADITRTPAGDEMTFLRDPWGIVIQLVKRARPLMESAAR
jgi:glyoxylase I family protein